LDLESLDEADLAELEKAGAELCIRDEDYDFTYEDFLTDW
jgi:hypothetical protein